MMRLPLLLIFMTLLPGSVLGSHCMPSQPCWPTASAIAALGLKLSSTGGKLLTPVDADWPESGMFWNLAYIKQPALIANVLNKDHIILTLKFAFKYNIKFSLYSTGHDFMGRSGTEGSIQISFKQMKNITIDLNCKENRDGCMIVQSGVQFGEVFEATMLKNSLSVGAHVSTVGVTGWTIGGGHSPLVRKFGLGVQNVLEFHVITADLNEVWAGPRGTTIKYPSGSTKRIRDTSLYYALRGGGSSFGVILDMKYKLYKDSIIEKFECTFAAFLDGTPKVFEIILKSLQDFMCNAPREFGLTITSVADCNQTTKTCSASVKVDVAHYGAKATSSNLGWFNKLDQLSDEWALKGLIGGGCRWVTYPNYNSYAKKFPASVPLPLYQGFSLVQKSLYSEQAIDVLVRHVNDTFYTSTGYMFISLFGGAISDIALKDFPISKGWKGALLGVESSFLLPINDIKMTEGLKQKTKELHQKLEAFSLGKYFNEAENDMAPSEWKDEFWGLANYQKLIAIKKRWDPENRFTCHQCIGSDFDA